MIKFIFDTFTKDSNNQNDGFCNQKSSYSLNNSSKLNGVSIPLHFDYNPNLKKSSHKSQQVINETSNTTLVAGKTDQTEISKALVVEEVPTLEIIRILNQFVFYLFLIYIVSLNLLGLWIFPYYVKEPLTLKG